MNYTDRYIECCQLFGIEPDASDEELYAAYEAARKKYDPSKYDDDVVAEMAEKRLEQVAEAFGYIKSSRAEARAASSKNRTLFMRSGSEYSAKCLEAADKIWSCAEASRGKKNVKIPPGDKGEAYMASCAYAMLMRHCFEFVVRNVTRTVSADPVSSPPEWAFSMMREGGFYDAETLEMLSEVKDLTDGALSYRSFLSYNDRRADLEKLYNERFAKFLSSYRKQNKNLYVIKQLDRLIKALSPFSPKSTLPASFLLGHLYSLLVYALASYICSEKFDLNIDYLGETASYAKLSLITDKEPLKYSQFPSFAVSSANNMDLCLKLLKRICHYCPESGDLAQLGDVIGIETTNSSVYGTVGARQLLDAVRKTLSDEYGVYSQTKALRKGHTDLYHAYMTAERDRIFDES